MLRNTVCSIVVVSVASGVAAASLSSSFMSAEGVASANGTWVYTVDISGFRSVDAFGDPDNSFFSIFHQPKEDEDHPLPGTNSIIGIGWDINLSTVGSSWASDAVISFGEELDLQFAVADPFPVMNHQYSSGGIIGLPNGDTPAIGFGTGEYGLRVEFYEFFDDTQDMAEAVFGTGSTLTIRTQHAARFVIPTPGVCGPLWIAGLIFTRRRRAE